MSEFKLLEIIFNNWLTWDGHVHYMCQITSTRLYILTLIKRACHSPNDITEVHTSIVRSVLEYACVLWHPIFTKLLSDSIDHNIQKIFLDIAFSDSHYMEAWGKQVWNLLSKGEKSMWIIFKEIQHPKHNLHCWLPEMQSILGNVRLRELFKSDEAFPELTHKLLSPHFPII